MVGRSLTATLRSRGWIHLLTPGSKDLDCRNQSQVAAYFSEHRPEYVFHLAGRIGGIKPNMTFPAEFLYENTMMAMNVIMAAKSSKVKKLLFAASSCIYPRECPQPMKEEHLLTGPLEPTNEGYALGKISGLKLCEYLNRQYGTQFLTLIPCNLYGFNDHFEAENSHVISALMYKMHVAKIRNENQVEVWGSGRSRREFLFVDDFSDAMIYFMNSWTAASGVNRINVGTGTDQSIKQLAEVIKRTVGFRGELSYNAERPDGMPQKLMNVERARTLGWSSKTDLEQGLKVTYEWYIKNNAARPDTQ